MSVALVVLHVLVCIFLVAVVLLQRGKGAEIGAVFGGGASGTVFGSRGAGNFLTRLTTVSATIFMITSLTLSYFWSGGRDDQLFQEGSAVEEPATEEPLFEEMGTVPAEEEAEEKAQEDPGFVELEPIPAPAAEEGEPAP
jgi:preprotein translocase subunit SecG